MRAIGRAISLVTMTHKREFRNAILLDPWTLLHTARLIFLVSISCIVTIRFVAPLGPDDYLLNDRVRSSYVCDHNPFIAVKSTRSNKIHECKACYICQCHCSGKKVDLGSKII